MNDVLPKPFTREGLLHMLEKHLGHLKKPITDSVNTMITPSAQPMPQSSTRQSLKEEESPANSPNQVPGVSPVGSANTDEYLNPAMQGSHSGLYGMPQQTPMTGYGASAMQIQQQPQQQQQQQHRRQISDISGGEDPHSTGPAKRQQIYTPQAMNPMQRQR